MTFHPSASTLFALVVVNVVEGTTTEPSADLCHLGRRQSNGSVKMIVAGDRCSPTISRKNRDDSTISTLEFYVDSRPRTSRRSVATKVENVVVLLDDPAISTARRFAVLVVAAEVDLRVKAVSGSLAHRRRHPNVITITLQFEKRVVVSRRDRRTAARPSERKERRLDAAPIEGGVRAKVTHFERAISSHVRRSIVYAVGGREDVTRADLRARATRRDFDDCRERIFVRFRSRIGLCSPVDAVDATLSSTSGFATLDSRPGIGGRGGQFANVIQFDDLISDFLLSARNPRLFVR